MFFKELKSNSIHTLFNVFEKLFFSINSLEFSFNKASLKSFIIKEDMDYCYKFANYSGTVIIGLLILKPCSQILT